MKKAMAELHVVSLRHYPILQQLQLEEALLRTDNRNWCLINEGSPQAIVMGISGRPEKFIDLKKLKQAPIPLVKRFSGGGTVIVDENTHFITLICNISDAGVSCCPQKIHGWAEALYRPVFNHQDFRLLENDYVFKEKKFGGNAQYLCKERWLHHSSLLWDYEPSCMEYLLLPPKMPGYRKARTHSDFLCKLKDYLSDRRAIKDNLMSSLNDFFNIKHVHIEEALPALERPHRKATEVFLF